MGIHHSTVSFGCEGNENLTGREKLGKLCFRPFPITLRGIRGKKFRSQIGVKTSDCNICEHVYVVCRSLCPWLHGMILVFFFIRIKCDAGTCAEFLDTPATPANTVRTAKGWFVLEKGRLYYVPVCPS